MNDPKQNKHPEIEWPSDWSPAQGWPTDVEGSTPDGRLTWRELDVELKKHGSSLTQAMNDLGRKPALRLVRGAKRAKRSRSSSSAAASGKVNPRDDLIGVFERHELDPAAAVFLCLEAAHYISRQVGLDVAELTAAAVGGLDEQEYWNEMDRALRAGEVEGVPAGTTLESFCKQMQLRGELPRDQED